MIMKAGGLTLQEAPAARSARRQAAGTAVHTGYRGRLPRVREARPGDNPALVRLADACPVEGEVALSTGRSPDFFALSRLEGDPWRVGVVDAPGGGIAGCVAVALRDVWLNGRRRRIACVTDLTVDPAHRNGAVADALTLWAQETCVSMASRDVPVLVTVPGGHRAMERRLEGPRGLPAFTPLGWVRNHTIPMIRRPPSEPRGLQVVRATPADLPAMARLWEAVAPGRQLAPALDAPGLARWIGRCPGLEPSSYLLARTARGRLAGFLGVWDQRALKQVRIVSYAGRRGAFRAAFNLAAPVLGGVRLPAPGRELACAAAVHVCVRHCEPEVLRALLGRACRELRERRYSFLSVGLDARDPLGVALRGLHAQPTDVGAYLSSGRGVFTDAPLEERPLHFEVALA